MPVPDSKSEARVLVVPSEALESASGNSLVVVKMRHPKTDATSCFLHNPSTHQLFEMLAFTEDHRSWFLGQRLVSDGRLLVGSLVNPVLLALPYLSRAERLVPLDQMLEDSQFPRTEETLVSCLAGDKLEVVADSKGDRDLNVWKYNEEKTLTWLEGRVEAVTLVLQKQGVDLTQGAVSLNYQTNISANSDGKVEYKKIALGIVQEYLGTDLGDKLASRLDLPEEKPSKTIGGMKRVSEGGDLPKSKKAKQEGPLEDYTKMAVKATVKEEQSAKQKALATSAKGTKSITSFFKKK